MFRNSRAATGSRREAMARLMAAGASPLDVAIVAGTSNKRAMARFLERDEGFRQRVEYISRARGVLEEKSELITTAHAARLLRTSTTNKEFATLVTPFYRAVGLFDHSETLEKEPYQMSEAELIAKLEALESEAAKRAKPVGGVFD